MLLLIVGSLSFEGDTAVSPAVDAKVDWSVRDGLAFAGFEERVDVAIERAMAPHSGVTFVIEFAGEMVDHRDARPRRRHSC